MQKYPQNQSCVGSSGQALTTNVSMALCNWRICHQTHVLCGRTTFVPHQTRSQINTVPTPAVAWTRLWLLQRGGGYDGITKSPPPPPWAWSRGLGPGGVKGGLCWGPLLPCPPPSPVPPPPPPATRSPSTPAISIPRFRPMLAWKKSTMAASVGLTGICPANLIRSRNTSCAWRLPTPARPEGPKRGGTGAERAVRRGRAGRPLRAMHLQREKRTHLQGVP